MLKHIVFSIAILVGPALAACGSDNNHEDEEASALDQGNTRGRALQAQVAPAFANSTESDAVAMAAAIVIAINNGEIAEANFVLSRPGTTGVHALATQFVTDHQASNAAVLSLLQARSLAPIDTPISQTLNNEAQAGLAQLQADLPRDLELDYVEMQIAMHQEASVVISAVRDAVPASATDMRGLLTDTLTTINSHLIHAQTTLRSLP
jgi:predicted outer membrane protein